jgi:hypothetical protein
MAFHPPKEGTLAWRMASQPLPQPSFETAIESAKSLRGACSASKHSFALAGKTSQARPKRPKDVAQYRLEILALEQIRVGNEQFFIFFGRFSLQLTPSMQLFLPQGKPRGQTGPVGNQG